MKRGKLFGMVLASALFGLASTAAALAVGPPRPAAALADGYAAGTKSNAARSGSNAEKTQAVPSPLLIAANDLVEGMNAEEKRLYWGDKLKYTVKVNDSLANDKELRIVILYENQEKNKKETVYTKQIYAGDCKGRGKTYAYLPERVGDFTAQLQDNKETVIGEIAEFTVQRADLAVEFREILSKKSGSEDPSRLTSGENIWITNNNGVRVSLSVPARLIREPGEAPGLYEISGVELRGADENVASMALKPGEYCYLMIETGIYIPKAPGRIAVTTEEILEERTVTADAVKALKFPEGGRATGIRLGEILEEDQAKFRSLPSVRGTSVVFAVKKSAVPFEVWVPVTILSENYEECDGRLHLVWEEIPEEIGHVDTDEFPVSPVNGRASALRAYAGYRTTLLIFGNAGDGDCEKTVRDVYLPSKEYTKDMKAIFLDVSADGKHLAGLAAGRDRMVFCGSRQSGVDYAGWRKKILAQYGQIPDRAGAPSVFLVDGDGDIVFHKTGEALSAKELRSALSNAGARPDADYGKDMKAFKKSRPFVLTGQVAFETTPDSTVWQEGVISPESLENGINALNFVRFVAGISPDVEVDEDYERAAQKASVLLAKNGNLDRYPDKPPLMPDDFYNEAAAGAARSNLYQGSANLAKIVAGKNGYMDDGDSANKTRLGRRRWCLNPSMKRTGMGYYNGYSAMYAEDAAAGRPEFDFIPWPAAVMPREYFTGKMWSVILNREEYYNLDASKVQVTVKGMGKTLHFSADRSDGYFAVNTEDFGSGPAVIFSPEAGTGDGNVYDVTVSGLEAADGSERAICYSVKFFAMEPGQSGGGGSGGGGGGSGGGGTSRRVSRNGKEESQAAAVTTLGAPITEGTWEQQSDGKWKLRLLDGTFPASRWALLSGRWYLLDADGYMAAGWRQADGAWYYFNADGSMTTGWQQIGGVWYYLSENGSMATGWRQVGARWYYLSENGSMATGWITDGDKQYYMDPSDGSMAVGWREIDKKACYFSPDERNGRSVGELCADGASDF